MKAIKLTSEELEQMSYADVANLILIENGKKMKIQDLFQKVIEIMHLPESYFESKIADFFALLSTDRRFTMLEKGFWDLSSNHTKKVVIEDDDDEEIIAVDEEDITEDDTESEVNYDDEDTVDDDTEDDDLKDLVILDGDEENDML